MMSSGYERELRAVLAGSPDGVRAVTRSCTELEKARAMLVIQRPFLVVRAAGSGMEGSGDILALRGDLCFPIEVKTTKSKKLYLSGRTRTQFNAMQAEGERCHLMPLYAQRLKGVRGDSWRIFRVETSTLSSKLALLSRRIPALPLTSKGNPMLAWDEGLPLHKFLAMLCRSEEDSSGAEIIASSTLEIALERARRYDADLASEIPDAGEGGKDDLPTEVIIPADSTPAWVANFRP
jgi:Holliday junction resolvase